MRVGYYQAAVCRRGHVIDSMMEPAMTRSDPLPVKCDTCGAKVLTECPNCTARIQGNSRSAAGMFVWEPAAFCHHCGHPYPWASHEAMAYHIENLLDEDDLAEGDRRALVQQLVSLRQSAAGDPVAEKRQVAALRMLQTVAPKAWALAAPVLQVILTAEMRRALNLPPA
jgi:hypothetical protein